MADVERYATVAALQGRLTERESALDDVTAALAAASTAVERYCDRVFTGDEAASARLFGPARPDRLSVDDIATADDLAVAVGRPGAFSAFTDVTPWPYNAAAKGEPFTELRTASAFPLSEVYPTVEVTARWGWAAVPDDVVDAVLLLGSKLYFRRGSPGGVAGMGDYGVVRIIGGDRDMQLLLEPYVRIGFGA